MGFLESWEGPFASYIYALAELIESFDSRHLPTEIFSACSALPLFVSTQLKWFIAQIFLREGYLATPHPLAFQTCRPISAPHFLTLRHSPTLSEHIR